MDIKINTNDVISNEAEKLNNSELMKVLDGKLTSVSKKSALNALKKRQPPEAFPIFEKLLNDTREKEELRYEAAFAISALKNKQCAQILTKHLNEKNTFIAAGIFKALAICGDKESLTQLLKIDTKEKEAKKALEYSKTILAYKLNNARFKLEPKKNLITLNPNSSIVMEKVKPDQSDISILEKTIDTRYLLISPDSKKAVFIKCVDNYFALVPNNNLSERKYAEIAKNKNIMFCVLEKIYCPEIYAPYYYILTDPKSANTFNIHVINTRGELLFGGNGNVISNAINFSVKTIADSKPGTPLIDIEGKLNPLNSEISFTKSLSALPAKVEKRIPKKL